MSDVIANRIVVYNAPATLNADDDQCRRFVFPNDPVVIAAVNDVLAFLIHDGVWRSSVEVQDIQLQSLIANVLNSQAIVRCSMIQLPIGTILPYLREVIPGGCLALDGATYTQDDYPNLYAVIPDVFKDGAGNFTLPDLTGRVIVGSGDAWNVGDEGGEETHVLTVGEMPSHTHVQDAHHHTTQVKSNTTLVSPSGATVVKGNANPALDTGDTTAVNQNTGGGGAHNNMQPYTVVNYCIVAE